MGLLQPRLLSIAYPQRRHILRDQVSCKLEARACEIKDCYEYSCSSPLIHIESERLAQLKADLEG
jgi:hypothetical protein